MRLARSAGGGVAPRRNNRIMTESATKESRDAKTKAKNAIHPKKTEHDKTKGQYERKRNKGNTENDKKKRGKTKNGMEKKRKKEKENGKGVRAAPC